MAEEFSRKALKVVVALICQTIGWNGIQSTPFEILIDLLQQYLVELGRVTHRYAELCEYSYFVCCLFAVHYIVLILQVIKYNLYNSFLCLYITSIAYVINCTLNWYLISVTYWSIKKL